jgi:hypothetical protein
MMLAVAFAEQYRTLPDTPIAPAVGAMALHLIERKLMSPEDFVGYPDTVDGPSFAVIEDAVTQTGAELGVLAVPTDETERASYVRGVLSEIVTGTMTTGWALSAGPGPSASIVESLGRETQGRVDSAVEALKDPTQLRRYARVLYVAATALKLPAGRQVIDKETEGRVDMASEQIFPIAASLARTRHSDE